MIWLKSMLIRELLKNYKKLGFSNIPILIARAFAEK